MTSRPYGMTDDGEARCINSEPGTFNHECGKPALWVGQKLDGHKSCFCEHCRWNGYEAREMVRWWEVAAELNDIEADPYAGSTAQVDDIVSWKDPKDGVEHEELRVLNVWTETGDLTVRGHFGKSNWDDRNREGKPTNRVRRLKAKDCSVQRRSS